LLPLKEVDGRVKSVTRCAGRGWVLALEGLEHLPGDAAVAEVAGGAGAEFDDVLGLGESILKSDRQRVASGSR